MKDFPAELYQHLIGKVIERIEESDFDEGLTITFTDGSSLTFGFSGCEGVIIVRR